MNPSSNDGRTPTRSSKPEEIEMSESTGTHGHGTGRSSTGSGSSSGAASTGGTTTNQTEPAMLTVHNSSGSSSTKNTTEQATGENIQMTVFASGASTASNVSAKNSDSGSGEAAADASIIIPESSGSTGSSSQTPSPTGLAYIWQRISNVGPWWTTRPVKTKITICLVLAVLLLFMVWVIWQVSRQKVDDTSTTVVPFTSLQPDTPEFPQMSSTPDEPIDDSTIGSPIWPEPLPPDLPPTASETIAVVTEGRTQSSQFVSDTSTTQRHFSKVTPHEPSTITTPSTRVAPPKPEPTVPSTFTVTPYVEPMFPKEETVTPYAKPTFPEEKTVTPYVEPTFPEEETVTPYEEPTFPEEKTVTPYVEPTFPEEETITPYEEITFPEESTSHVVHTSPSTERTTIRDELSTKPQTSPQTTKPSYTTKKLTTQPPVVHTSPPTKPHTLKPTEASPASTKSPYLVEYENKLRESLNFNVDPCNDFYKYVCDKYDHPLNIQYKAMHELYVTLDAAMQQERDQRANTVKPYPLSVQVITDIYFECVNANNGNVPNVDLQGFIKLPSVKFACMKRIFPDNIFICYRLYVDYHSGGVNSSSYLSKSIEKVQELMTFMKASFKKDIEEHITWLDDETRQRVLRKLDKLSALIGYPKVIFDDQFLLYLYSIDNTIGYFKPGDNYRTKLAMLKIAKDQKDSGKIRLIFDNAQLGYEPIATWARDNIITWNSGTESCYYTLNTNLLTIPIHWLRLPTFDAGFPAFYNFAMLGNTLGHEMTHGLDKLGSDYDEDGQLMPGHMWTDATRAHFDEQAQCFVRQYGQLRVDDGWTTMMDGNKTLNENIADGGGYKIAYYALKSFMQSGHSVSDPFLFDHKVDQFSSEQLFFIASAQTYCEPRPQSAAGLQKLVDDVHSPPWYRVNLPLCNFDRFAEAFKCNATARMNCTHKCIIW